MTSNQENINSWHNPFPFFFLPSAFCHHCRDFISSCYFGLWAFRPSMLVSISFQFYERFGLYLALVGSCLATSRTVGLSSGFYFGNMDQRRTTAVTKSERKLCVNVVYYYVHKLWQICGTVYLRHVDVAWHVSSETRWMKINILYMYVM